MKNSKGLCYECVRFHPKGAGNCVLAKGWMALEHKNKFKLAVVECPMFLAPKEVFEEEVNAQPTKTKKVKTGNKKIDDDESEV